jgi:hypothetical protein
MSELSLNLEEKIVRALPVRLKDSCQILSKAHIPIFASFSGVFTPNTTFEQMSLSGFGRFYGHFLAVTITWFICILMITSHFVLT